MKKYILLLALFAGCTSAQYITPMYHVKVNKADGEMAWARAQAYMTKYAYQRNYKLVEKGVLNVVAIEKYSIITGDYLVTREIMPDGTKINISAMIHTIMNSKGVIFSPDRGLLETVDFSMKDFLKYVQTGKSKFMSDVKMPVEKAEKKQRPLFDNKKQDLFKNDGTWTIP